MSDDARIFLRTTNSSATDAPIADRFHACVRNTGNYFFEESLLRQLTGLQVIGCLEDLPSRIEMLVLSMSNFISSTTDLGYIYDALSSRSVNQVVIIGAGAQAYEYGENVSLTKGTRRFLAYVASRSVSIGVRGYYTAEILDRMGIRNVDVIGCPSAFWRDNAPDIPWTELPSNPRLAVHSTPLGHFRDKVSALMAHGIKHDATYVLQSEMWMMPLLGVEGDEILLDGDLLYYAYPETSPVALREWLTRKLVVYFGMEDWLRQIGTYDFVYGSRFHGNMAAIQAGVPALNLPFDSRTRELCEYLNLPNVPLYAFDKAMTPQALRDAADLNLFCRTYPIKQQHYAQFLTRNGLQHCLSKVDGAPRPFNEREAAVLATSVRGLMDDLIAVGGIGAQDLRSMVFRRLLADRDELSRLAVEAGQFSNR